jgi:hypothetical protein
MTFGLRRRVSPRSPKVLSRCSSQSLQFFAAPRSPRETAVAVAVAGLRALAVPPRISASISRTAQTSGAAPVVSRHLLQPAVIAVLLPRHPARRATDIGLAEPSAIVAPGLLRRRSHLGGLASRRNGTDAGCDAPAHASYIDRRCISPQPTSSSNHAPIGEAPLRIIVRSGADPRALLK